MAQVSQRARRRGAQVVFAGALVASTTTSALAVSVSDPSPPGMWTRDVVTVDSVDELIDASPLIVEGRVTASSKGRVVGEGDGALRFREITVDVTRSWGDARTEAGRLRKQVTIEIVGWDADGTEYGHINGHAIPRPGERWVMFLVEKSDAPGFFRPTNSAATARLTEGKVESAELDTDGARDRPPLVRFVGRSVEDLARYLDSRVKGGN